MIRARAALIPSALFVLAGAAPVRAAVPRGYTDGGVDSASGIDDEVQPIPLSDSDGPVALHVLLVARRVLGGTTGRRPRCRALGSGEPPCSRRGARDHLQLAVDIGASMAPTLLVADAGIFTRRPRRG